MKIISVVGARPNFMKIAPFCRALKAYPQVQHILVHTGQHYDVRMSDSFFVDLGIPEPDVHLNIGSGTHAEQVGKTMIEFEKVVKAEKPLQSLWLLIPLIKHSNNCRRTQEIWIVKSSVLSGQRFWKSTELQNKLYLLIIMTTMIPLNKRKILRIKKEYQFI